MHSDDADLQEDYLDWFFLSKFGKGQGYWKNLTEEKLENIVDFQNEYDKNYWDTWIKIYQKIHGK